MSKADQSLLCWRKSSKSAASNCVEVASHDTSILVRDSKDPHGPVMRFEQQDWAAFVGLVKTSTRDGGVPS